jgi:hypothetical protein
MSLYRENEHGQLVKPRERLDPATAADMARTGFGRGRLMAAAGHGDTVARDALRAYRDATPS